MCREWLVHQLHCIPLLKTTRNHVEHLTLNPDCSEHVRKYTLVFHVFPLSESILSAVPLIAFSFKINYRSHISCTTLSVGRVSSLFDAGGFEIFLAVFTSLWGPSGKSDRKKAKFFVNLGGLLMELVMRLI